MCDAIPGALYKRIDADTFVRYDPARDAYDVVPADRVPPVEVAAARVRLSAAERRDQTSADPHGDFRKATLLAMLDFQERAHAAGDPESARPYLDALAQLAGDPDGARALRMSWLRQQAGGRYGFKAVGVGEHAGRVKYGQDAERALRAQDAANPPEAAGQTFPPHREAKGWVAQGTKAVGYGDYAGKKIYGKAATQRLQNQQSRDERVKSGARARDLLYKLHANAGQGVSPEELTELATHLPNLTVERLRRARLLLDASWGGEKLRKAGMIDKLQSHIRGMVDAQMQAAGAEPVNPVAAEEPPAAAEQPPAPAQKPTPKGTPAYPGSPAPPDPNKIKRPSEPGYDTKPPAPKDAPAPAQPAAQQPAPAAPESSDYSKFDAIHHTTGDRAKAEQIARVTGVPVRPEEPAAGAGDSDLAPHGITEDSSRDDVTAAAARIAPELGEKVRKLPKAKQLAAIREHLKNAPKPVEPAPAPAPTGTSAAPQPTAPAPTVEAAHDLWRSITGARSESLEQASARLGEIERMPKDVVAGLVERLGFSKERSHKANVEKLRRSLSNLRLNQQRADSITGASAEQQPAPAEQQPEAPKADAVHPAVEKYAQAMLKQQLDRFKEFPPEQQERLRQKGALSDANIQKFLEEQRATARERMGSFGDKEEVWKHLKRGTFHPTNKHSREMFEAATGVKLPLTAGGTKEAVRKYLGDEFVNGKEDEAARAEQQAADAERQKKEAAAKAEEEKYNGFGSDMAAVARARARKFLDKEARVDGKEADIRTHIGNMIADGWTIRAGADGFRRLVKGDRSFSEKDFGKTAFEYAQHLLAQKRDAENPEPESTPLTESLFKSGGTLAGKSEPAADLPDAPPGQLFDAGDEVPRAEGVRTLEGIADAARRRIPDLDMEPAKAGAPLEDHLDALTAIDRHMRKKGFPTSYFGDAADAIEELKKGIAEGKYDRDDLENLLDSAKRGEFVDTTNPAELAREMREKGLFDEARFFERHAHKVGDAASTIIASTLAKMPKDDEPDRKPAARTLSELEDRVREEFGKPGVDSADAYFEAMADVPPAVKRQFFDKHNIKTGDGNGAAYYKTVRQVRDKFAPAEQPAPKPVEQKSKEPHETTREEYTKQKLAADAEYQNALRNTPDSAEDAKARAADRFKGEHAVAVAKALAAGKKVPPEVLKDYRPAQNLDNANTNDKVTDERPAEPRAQGEGASDVVLEEAGRGTGEGGDRAGERVGAPVRAVGAGGETGAGEGDGKRVPVLRPGEGGGSDQALQPTDGQRDGPGDGAGTGAARPVRPRLKRKSGGPPRDDAGVRLGGGADGTEPALPNPTPAEAVVSEPPAAENPTDVSAGNFRYTDREFFKGGQKAKYNANLAAIRVLKQIQEEGRDTATPEEQAILSKYTGWGQFPALFNDYYDKEFRKSMEERGVSFGEFDTERRKWDAERETLQGLMTPDEWKAAGRSTLNAHYTHPDVVDAHWKIAQQLGFKGGRYLETSAGAGYYLGLMPPELAARTRSSAVEKDAITAGILKLLYPASNVQHSGFEKHDPGDNFYDLVASNVPFGDYKVHDPRYNKHQANIHDYFFLKSLDKVRPGGLVMHITSTGTLDKMDPAIRKKLYEQGDLVGAIRFPGDAHKENAGTSVVTDMLIFRKRLPGEQPGDRSWLDTTTVPDPDGGEPIPVNNYFAKNPHMVLGTIDRKGKLYGGKQANVSATEDYDDRLNKAVAALPSNVMTSNRAPKERFAPDTLAAPGDVKQGGFKVKDGKVFVRKGSELVHQEHDTKTAEKIGAHVEVLDAVRALLRKETAGEDATKERANLNAVYDAFVKKHGPLNLPANKKAFNAPDDAPVLHALENYDSKSKKATKTDIFTKPVVAPVPRVDKAGSVAEGLGVSLHETGGLDVKRIAELTGKDERAVGRELLENGLAYEDPSHGWQPADQYLSGNVRQKLATARAAAAADPRYAANVAALEKVQPADLHHDEISANLGAAWIPPSDIEEFSREMLNSRPGALKVTRVPHTNEWHADWNDKYTATSAAAKQKWGVSDPNTGKLHADFADLLKAALSGSPMTIKTYLNPDDDKPTVNRDLTEAANAKVQELRDEFKNWIWVDQERRERLHRHYNDNFNNIRPINYDGSHLKFPGMTPNFQLRPHQKNFVWQVVSTGKGLAAHEVGTGKTASMIAAAMELRRLGLAKKPCIAALKANAEAIAAEARRLYPGARVLSLADAEDAGTRKELMSRVATGDYDIVVMTHPQLDLLGMRPETQAKYLEEELSELDAAHAAAVAASPKDGGGRAGKDLKKARENLEAKLQAALKAEVKDDAVHFEDLGIDQLFVDEAHAYKALPAYSKRRGLKGISNRRSHRATSMLMRARWLMENNGGRGVVFATGTPITNTVGELYVMQKYLQPEELKSRGIDTFDAWASTFAEQETKQEKKADGTYDNVTRLSKYSNVPELKAVAGQVLDNQRVDDLKDRFPFADEAAARKHAAELYAKNPYTGGKTDPTDEDLNAVGMEVVKTENGYEVASPIVSRPRRKDVLHTLPPIEMTKRMMEELQARAKAIKGKRPGEPGDNMLNICTDGRKGAIDARMLFADAPDDPDSKANRLVEQVLKISKEHPGKTQMIFSNMGVNPPKGEKVPKASAEEADDEAGPDSGVTVFNTASRTGFHLYGDIIDKLVEGGIPRDKIADFSQLEGKKKLEAVAKLKTGEMLVALGSTEKLGTGVNAQDKLIAMHHLDVPYLPAALEQREGRGWRNGNENNEVQIHKYVTQKSLDDVFWGIVGRKDRMIKQMLSRKGGAPRDMVEEDSEELTPDQIMAAASGDPRILEKVQVEDDIRKLQNAAKRHDREQYEFQRGLRVAESKKDEIQRRIDGFDQAIKHLEARPDFELKVRGGEVFNSRKEGGLEAANKALGEAFEKTPNGFTVGEYRGLRLLKDSGNMYLLMPNNTRQHAKGSIYGIESVARYLRDDRDSAQAELERHEKDTATLRANAGKKFPKADELQKKIERQKELEKALKEEQDKENAPPAG